jgi:isocitrate dehydrogenase
MQAIKNSKLIQLFKKNQIVKAEVGTFIIIGFRLINDEWYATLKRYNSELQISANGQLCLPLDAIKHISKLN